MCRYNEAQDSIYSRPFTIVCCYGPRPNNEAEEFYNSLKIITAKIDNEGKELYTVRDLISNLMSRPQKNKLQRLLNELMEVYQLTQLILEATRVT